MADIDPSENSTGATSVGSTSSAAETASQTASETMFVHLPVTVAVCRNGYARIRIHSTDADHPSHTYLSVHKDPQDRSFLVPSRDPRLQLESLWGVLAQETRDEVNSRLADSGYVTFVGMPSVHKGQDLLSSSPSGDEVSAPTFTEWPVKLKLAWPEPSAKAEK